MTPQDYPLDAQTQSLIGMLLLLGVSLVFGFLGGYLGGLISTQQHEAERHGVRRS